MSAKTEHVKAAHQRQLAKGWRRLGLRLPPEAGIALDVILTGTGLTPTEVITKLLVHEALYEHLFPVKPTAKQ